MRIETKVIWLSVGAGLLLWGVYWALHRFLHQGVISGQRVAGGPILEVCSLALALLLFGGFGIAVSRLLASQKQAEEALHGSEERLRCLTSSVPVGVFVTDAGGRCTYANDRLLATAGLTLRESLGQGWTRAVHLDDRERVTEKAGSWAGARCEKSLEFRMVTPWGETRLVQVRTGPLVSGQGKQIGRVGTVEDVTDRRRAEQSLRESEETYRAVFEGAGEGILVADIATKTFTHANRAICAMLGYSREELTQMGVADIHAEGDLPRVIAEFEAQSRGEKLLAPDIPCLRKDGSVVWVDICSAKVVLDGRECSVGFFTDTTERKRAGQALRESNERFETLLSSVNDVAWAAAADGSEFLYMNDAAERVYGRSRDEFFADPYLWLQVIHPDDRARVERESEQLLRCGAVESEYRIVRPDGDVRWISDRKHVVHAGGKPVRIGGLATDITDRKRTEEALKESEEKYRLLIENANEAIVVRQDGALKLSNRKATEITGYSPEELASKPFLEFVHEDDRAMVQERYSKRLQGDSCVPVYSFRLVAKSGRIRWLEINAVVFTWEGKPATLNFLSDITERKLMESQLLQAQKLEAIGQLAAGIAHEINTPAQYVGDNTRFLQDSFTEILGLLQRHNRLLAEARLAGLCPALTSEIDSAARSADVEYLTGEVPRAIEQSLEGIERISGIVAAMREFAHPDTDERAPTDVNRAIQSTVAVARAEWKHVAEVKMDLDDNLPLVPCLPGRFNQVILNLLINAVHAIGSVVGDGSQGKGELAVSTRRHGDSVEIRVSDTGPGIPEGIQSRIFDPFFTTKDHGVGTGQGLAISHDVVVKKHGGTIAFETEEGKGATFIVRLPIDPREVEVGRAA